MPQRTITLADRVAMAKGAVEVGRAKAKQVEVEINGALDDLAKAEAEVLGKAAGWEGIELSGLIEEGKNPYYEKPAPEAAKAPPPPPAAEEPRLEPKHTADDTHLEDDPDPILKSSDIDKPSGKKGKP